MGGTVGALYYNVLDAQLAIAQSYSLNIRLWGTSAQRRSVLGPGPMLGMTTVALEVALGGAGPSRVLPMRARRVLVGSAFTNRVAA